MALVAHDLPPWLCEDAELLERLGDVVTEWQTGHPRLFACHGFDREKRLLLTDTPPPLALREMRSAASELPLARRVAWAVARTIELAAAATSGPGVHGDIADGSVRFDAEGHAVLVPPLQRLQSTLQRTGAGRIKSALDQLSPEGVRGETLDPESDVFQLGLVLRGLLGAPNPFAAENDVARLMKILAPEPVARLDALGIQVSSPFDDVIAKALSKNAADRFDSPAAFADALAPFSDPDPTTRIVIADAAMGRGPGAPLDLFGEHPIRNACPKSWTELTETSDASVRHCAECNLSVHRVTTIAALVPLSGSCIAFAPRSDFRGRD